MLFKESIQTKNRGQKADSLPKYFSHTQKKGIAAPFLSWATCDRETKCIQWPKLYFLILCLFFSKIHVWFYISYIIGHVFQLVLWCCSWTCPVSHCILQDRKKHSFSILGTNTLLKQLDLLCKDTTACIIKNIVKFRFYKIIIYSICINLDAVISENYGRKRCNKQVNFVIKKYRSSDSNQQIYILFLTGMLSCI